MGIPLQSQEDINRGRNHGDSSSHPSPFILKLEEASWVGWILFVYPSIVVYGPDWLNSLFEIFFKSPDRKIMSLWLLFGDVIHKWNTWNFIHFHKHIWWLQVHQFLKAFHAVESPFQHCYLVWTCPNNEQIIFRGCSEERSYYWKFLR